jgi:hypothetical protein
MNRHLSDKGNGHHNYTKLYSQIFDPICNDKLNILEIGIGSVNPFIPSNMTGGELGKIYKPGASIRGWREYFPNSIIYACDIDKDILNFDEENISGFYFDQTDNNFLNEITTNGLLRDKKFDIIIDDGLHHFPTNYNVMKYLISKVKKGGYYIIEDIINTEYDIKIINSNSKLLENNIWQYIQLPNLKNTCDNNLFIVKMLN